MIGEIEYFQLDRQRYFCALLRGEKKKKKKREKKKIQNIIEFFRNYHCFRNLLNEINSELKIVLILQRDYDRYFLLR